MFVERYPASVLAVTAKILRSGKYFEAASVFKAIHELQSIKAQTKKLLKDAVLVLPTCAGTWTREQVREDPIGKNSDLGRYTNHCNLLDLCAVAVPSDSAAENLPFGITFFALAGNENLLCGAAESFVSAGAIAAK